MKKTVALSFILLTLVGNGFAQDSKVENKVYSVQAGLFGVWGNYERQLHNNITLKTEVGLDYSFWIYGDNYSYVFTPVINVEPRWYYNLNKRELKGKSIDNNGGNYFSLLGRYHPNLAVISNGGTGNIDPDISLIPSWGFRRNMGAHFNFETSVGLGYLYLFSEKSIDSSYKGEWGGNFTVRLGYTF